MKIGDLTNVELLYNEDLKNKILVKIGGTKYHMLCTYVKKTDLWNAHIIEMVSSKRKIIAQQINEADLAKLINHTLNSPIRSYKHLDNIKEFAEELRNILIKITIKTNGQRQKSSNRRSRKIRL